LPDELKAALVQLIQQAGLVEQEARGLAVLKLMRAVSSAWQAQPSFPIVAAGVDLDKSSGIIFQVIVAGHPDTIRMERCDIINLASQAGGNPQVN